MATKVKGIEMFTGHLTKLTDDIGRINRTALGAGAVYAADEVKAALQSMPVREDGEYGTAKNKLYGATKSEKDQIIQNFGISKVGDKGGSYDISVGFTGYVDTPSNRFNGHIPTGMLMQCIEYGTDFRKGTHTVGNAVKRIKGTIPEKVQERLDEEVKKIMEE